MEKKDWFKVILPLFLCIIIDQLTKNWASDLIGIKSYGILHFALHHNHGAMLGLFSDLPSVLRIVSLSTGGAFLLCTYALLQYLLPLKSLKLRIGMSLLIGGILGNVLDRIMWGYVIDFIIFGNFKMMSPAFNFADAIQWVGYFLIVYTIIKDGDLLWPENNIRKKYWVNMHFQLKYSFVLMGVGIALTLIGLVFSYTYLKVTISDLVGDNDQVINKFIIPYVITYSVISLAFSFILFTIGKIMSHRIAGPLYAFERFLEDVMSGKETQLKLRAGDEFKHLEKLSNEIKVKIEKIRKERSIQVVEYQEPEKNADELNINNESSKIKN